MKGLIVDVYRANGYDCTADGASKDTDKFILVDKSINAPFEVKEGEIYLKLVRRFLSHGEYLHVEPIFRENKKRGVGPMFGGNFVYSSDSRFPSKYPLAIHDRYESQECYNAHAND